jgi:hypothetical protein
VDRRRFLLTSLAGALAAPLAAQAQRAIGLHRIGYLAPGPASCPSTAQIEAFRQRLADLGYLVL